MESGIARLPWFALQVRTGHEKSVVERLKSKCQRYFLPLYKSRRRWSDRIKEIEMPLFPGYLFCGVDVTNRLPILTTPGVIRIVGIGGVPQPLEESEVAAIQSLVRSELPSQPWPFLEIGERVRIEHGPLRGIEGILLDFRGRHRLVVSVTVLQRSVAVEIDGAWVSSTRPHFSHGVAASPLAAKVCGHELSVG